MSKAEEILKTRLKRLLKAQAVYIKGDTTINNNQKIEQLMVIEELMDVLNRQNIIDEMNIHKYTEKRIIAEDQMENKEER